MQPASMPQPVMMSQHAFKVMALSPEVSAEQPASKKLSEQKISYQKESDAKAGNLGNMTYATVSFIESEIQAEQQRTTAIVQTSDKGGYYINVFRSRKKEGGDKTHDYFYHNLGQEMKVMDAASDKALDMKPTEELAFAGDHLYAYSYIYNKVSAEMTSSVKTQVDENRTIDRYQSGKKNVAFLMHSMGHHPACSEIDASIIYADYYYLEALNRAKKIAF